MWMFVRSACCELVVFLFVCLCLALSLQSGSWGRVCCGPCSHLSLVLISAPDLCPVFSHSLRKRLKHPVPAGSLSIHTRVVSASANLENCFFLSKNCFRIGLTCFLSLPQKTSVEPQQAASQKTLCLVIPLLPVHQQPPRVSLSPGSGREPLP